MSILVTSSTDPLYGSTRPTDHPPGGLDDDNDALSSRSSSDDLTPCGDRIGGGSNFEESPDFGFLSDPRQYSTRLRHRLPPSSSNNQFPHQGTEEVGADDQPDDGIDDQEDGDELDGDEDDEEELEKDPKDTRPPPLQPQQQSQSSSPSASRPASFGGGTAISLSGGKEGDKPTLSLARTSTTVKKKKRRRKKSSKIVVNLSCCKYPVVMEAAVSLGWEVDHDEDRGANGDFTLFWTDSSVSPQRAMKLQNWQRINHFPYMHLICKKVSLSNTLGRMRRVASDEYRFYPQTWTLPAEVNQFRKYLNSLTKKKTFIIKPSGGCQGRGIMLTRNPLEIIDTLEDVVVQQYITKPLLIEGFKFDMRVYALVTSVSNLSIFLFDDGLVRMCTEAYQKPTDSNLEHCYMHLSNYAINKHNPNYVFNEEGSRGDVGSKRDFVFLNQFFASTGHDPVAVWKDIEDVIIRTLIAAQPQLKHMYNLCFPQPNDGHTCFEILGFDIFLDHKFKPFLLEVNHTPSFYCDTPLDQKIKFALISETMQLLNLKPEDRIREKERAQELVRLRIETRERGIAEDRAEMDRLEAQRRALERRQHEELTANHFRRIYPCPEDRARQALYEELLLSSALASVAAAGTGSFQRSAATYPDSGGVTANVSEKTSTAGKGGCSPNLLATSSSLPTATSTPPLTADGPSSSSSTALPGQPSQVTARKRPSRKSVGSTPASSTASSIGPSLSSSSTRSSIPKQQGQPSTQAQVKKVVDAQQRLVQAMQKHRRRIQLGPRLSVFQLSSTRKMNPNDPGDGTVPNAMGGPSSASSRHSHSLGDVVSLAEHYAYLSQYYHHNPDPVNPDGNGPIPFPLSEHLALRFPEFLNCSPRSFRRATIPALPPQHSPTSVVANNPSASSSNPTPGEITTNASTGLDNGAVPALTAMANAIPMINPLNPISPITPPHVLRAPPSNSAASAGRPLYPHQYHPLGLGPSSSSTSSTGIFPTQGPPPPPPPNGFVPNGLRGTFMGGDAAALYRLGYYRSSFTGRSRFRPHPEEEEEEEE